MFHTKFYENLKSQYFNCFSTTEKYLVKVLFQKYKAISAVCLLDKQSVWNVLFSSFHDIKLLHDISYLKFYINFAEKTNGCSFPLASKNTFLKLRFKSTRFFYYKVKSDCLLNKKKKKEICYLPFFIISAWLTYTTETLFCICLWSRCTDAIIDRGNEGTEETNACDIVPLCSSIPAYWIACNTTRNVCISRSCRRIKDCWKISVSFCLHRLDSCHEKHNEALRTALTRVTISYVSLTRYCWNSLSSLLINIRKENRK